LTVNRDAIPDHRDLGSALRVQGYLVDDRFLVSTDVDALMAFSREPRLARV
jgi:hypothetical protein